MENTLLAELNYTRASTFHRSSTEPLGRGWGLPAAVGGGGGEGGGAGKGRQAGAFRQGGARMGDSLDKTEQCVLLFQTSSEFR